MQGVIAKHYSYLPLLILSPCVSSLSVVCLFIHSCIPSTNFYWMSMCAWDCSIYKDGKKKSHPKSIYSAVKVSPAHNKIKATRCCRGFRVSRHGFNGIFNARSDITRWVGHAPPVIPWLSTLGDQLIGKTSTGSGALWLPTELGPQGRWEVERRSRQNNCLSELWLQTGCLLQPEVSVPLKVALWTQFSSLLSSVLWETAPLLRSPRVLRNPVAS